MKHFRKAILLTALVSAGAVTAAPMVYQDRAAFVAATDPNAWVDFNEFEETTSFYDQTLSVGPISLFTTSPTNGANHIRTVSSGIDGTSFVFASMRQGMPIHMDFFAPVRAWGADVEHFGAAGRHGVMRFFDENSAVVGEIDVSGNTLNEPLFYGIDLDGALATRMEFDLLSDHTQDNFWFDNVALTLDRAQPAPVPLPASGLFFATGGLALAALRRRKTGG